jgi:hypothetical protein
MSQSQKTKLENFDDFSVQVRPDISIRKIETHEVLEDIQASSFEKRKREAKKPLYLNRV